MPRLDLRLKAVAKQIRSKVHVDIGSDHAHLLIALLSSGRIEQGIAVENKQQPYQNSKRALAGFNADIRLGDGLNALASNEADSLSICGMGAQSIVDILGSHPDRIPDRIVLQPNRSPELVRQWAIVNHFHLIDETIAHGHWPYQIMSFLRSDDLPDPAYRDVDLEAALLFGPLMLKYRNPDFLGQLKTEYEYLSRFNRLSRETNNRLNLIRDVIGS